MIQIKLLYILIILVIGHVTYRSDIVSNFTTQINNNIPDTQGNNIRSYDNGNLSYRLLHRDQSVVNNPLAPPERRVEIQQYPTVLFNEKTRGTPDNYHMVGLLYNDDNTVDKKYQLYGRRVYPGSYEWEYYVRGVDSGGLEFKFPIELDNQREIRDNTQITLPFDSNNVYSVKIYEYDQPRYNPYVV